MKPIAINGRFLSQAVTGVQRYAIEVISAMDEMLAAGELERPEASVEILVQPSTICTLQLKFMTVRSVGPGTGQVWEQLCLPLHCRGTVLFTPCGGAPLMHSDHVFTIPDAGVFATPNAYSRGYGSWYRWHHRRAVMKRGMHLITVSEFSKKELVRWTGASPAHIEVITEGHEHALRHSTVDVLEKLSLRPQCFVLCVGSANPNKNVGAALEGFAIFRHGMSAERSKDYKFVLAGGSNSRVFGAADASPESVTKTGYLTDGELRSLYENAMCFVFPSLYEGFGLPPLEAMALGCPVICSNAASLPSVCGDAARLFDPLNRVELAQRIDEVAGSVSLRDEMIARGKARCHAFRWREAARATWLALMKAAQS